MKRSARWVGIVFAILACSGLHGAQADTATVTVPTSLTFFVNDVSTATTGTPNPFTVSFSSASLTAGNTLRISVKANAADFTPPSGTAKIPASNLSWTASNAVGGSGFNGTLSASVFTQIYQSNADPSSGQVDTTWRLAAPGASIRAGDHALTLTWKVESVAP